LGRADWPDWPDWYVGQPATGKGFGRHLYTTNRHPLFYVQINKCGCTFLRNLLFYIDNNRPHPFSDRIHSFDHEFVKASAIPAEVLTASKYVFCAVRDPIDRFLSLYFDKLCDVENQRDIWMRKLFEAEAGLQLGADLNLEIHRANCLKALNWIGLNLDGKTEAKTNPHWQRQSVVLGRVSAFRPKLLDLDNLSQQLAQLLLPLVPDIVEVISKITERNESIKPFSRAEIMNDELATAIHTVYPDDINLISQARRSWASGDYQRQD